MGETLKRAAATFARSVAAVLALLARWVAFPFRRLAGWVWGRGLVVRAIVAALILPWVLGYLHFVWNAAYIRGFDVNWPEALAIEDRVAIPGAGVVPPAPAVAVAPRPGTPLGNVAAAPRPGTPAANAAAAAAAAATPAPTVCGRSYIVDATAAMVDLNVRRNLWISSNPFYKTGFFFLIDWDRTKFMDNKAAFQRGVHQAASRAAADLADVLGRVRGTSQADPDLQIARGGLQFDQFTWAFNPFSERPFGPTTRSQTFYLNALNALERYQARLITCQASFDERSDNLLQFLDRLAADIGSTSATLLERAESHNSGWFDTRADDLFMFTKGQMYGYYGILRGARADFAEVVVARDLAGIWDNMDEHFRHAIGLDPWIISNGREDGLFAPSHLTAMGFYVLRARANLVELRAVLDR